VADESFELAEADGSGKSASVRARPGRSNKLGEGGIGTGAELSSVDMGYGTAVSGDRSVDQGIDRERGNGGTGTAGVFEAERMTTQGNP